MPQTMVSLKDVQNVYSGPEFHLWELLMGEQIHVGGLASSRELARTIGNLRDRTGIDLCCGTGAGMRFLLLLCGVEHMTGVDATRSMIEIGRERSKQAGVADRVTFITGDACDTGLPPESADFVWGEDSWCYVVDKPRLVSEAARLIRSGGVVAFTDWMAQPDRLSVQGAERFCNFMKFPGLQSLNGYARMLEHCGLEVIATRDTGRFASALDVYMRLLRGQFRFDALRILGFSDEQLDTIIGELQFAQDLAHAGALHQGMIVAQKS